MIREPFRTLYGRPLSEFSREEIIEARRRYHENMGLLMPTPPHIDPHTAEPGFYWMKAGATGDLVVGEVSDYAGRRTIYALFEESGFSADEFTNHFDLVAKIEPPDSETA